MKRYRQRGGVPDQHMYNSVAGMYARSRDWTRALRVVQAMEQRGHEADRAMLISITRRLEEAMEWEANQEDAGSRDLVRSAARPTGTYYCLTPRDAAPLIAYGVILCHHARAVPTARPKLQCVCVCVST